MHIEEISQNNYEKIIYGEDSASGLRAIISIHNTNRGPAVGGTRLYPYSSKQHALTDVLRLSRGMTYKSALADISFGGGKSVIIAEPKQKSAKLFHTFGALVNSLGGHYYCAEDVNTTPQDMALVREKTPYVLGLEGASGDPSPLTALGVFTSIEVTAAQLGLPLEGLKVVLQGVGHVGAVLTQMLRQHGATVYIADLNQEKVLQLAQKTGATPITPAQALTTACDIFAPCAMGAILNQTTIPNLMCKAVVGAANNQLETPEDALRLHKRGILYAPDYLVNAGGVINIWFEQHPSGYNAEAAKEKVLNIGKTLENIYTRAKAKNIPPAHSADELAEERFAHKTEYQAKQA